MELNISKIVFFVGILALAAAPLQAFERYAAFGPVPARSVSLGDLTFTGVSSRIFSPNGDGANDKARFNFENPELVPVQGEIFDLSGAHVAGLKPSSSNPEEVLLWDGKDVDGRSVPAGIYVYQIDFQGKHATGTVIVAR